jgi:hypothetical protein
MGSSSTSLGTVSVLRCLVLFDGTNYRDWVSHIHLYMCGLRLWKFLTGEMPCPPPPSAPTQPVILEKTTGAEKERLITDYDDHLSSYESQFRAYRTWLYENARADSVLVASMEYRFSSNIVELERSHEMWTFLHRHYEHIGQSTFLAAIHQEQLLRQGDDTIDAFFDQLFAVWHHIDTLGPQLSPTTYQSCKDQKSAL